MTDSSLLRVQDLCLSFRTTVGVVQAVDGVSFTMGHRQCLALLGESGCGKSSLARAILDQPKILILDEATSSLDSESERFIQKYIAEIRGTCTIVVVAHRMSTIQNADKIVVLQDGEIVEEGKYQNLLAKSGVFANYHQLQSTG